MINSELRLPIFTTLFNKPINNAFLRNFSLIQFFDLGTAWNGKYNAIKRPEEVSDKPILALSQRPVKGGRYRPVCRRIWIWGSQHAAGLFPTV